MDNKAIKPLLAVFLVILAAALWKTADFAMTERQPGDQTAKLASLSPPPGDEATTESLLTYEDASLGLKLKYPRGWNIQEYGPFKDNAAKLKQLAITRPQTNPNLSIDREFYFALTAWDPRVTSAQILADEGVQPKASRESDITVGGRGYKEFTFTLPDQIASGMHYYRLYVAKSPKATYSLSSKFCNETKQPECDTFLGNLELDGTDGLAQSSASRDTIPWQEAVNVLKSGRVKMIMQAHSLKVTLTLDDGSKLETTEPKIDDIFDEINNCGRTCNGIIKATE